MKWPALGWDFALPEELGQTGREMGGVPASYLLVGIMVGILLTLVVYLLLLFVRYRRRRRHSPIFIPGDVGDVYIQPKAVRDFVINSLNEFRHTTVHHVQVIHRHGAYQLLIAVSMVPDTPARLEKDRMQEKVKEDLIDVLGVRSPVEVDLDIRRYNADPRPAD